MNKWVMIGLVGCGLLALGYMVHVGQQNKTSRLSQAPISVAAVRGGADGVPAGDAGSAGNVVADYSSALQDDVATAQKRVDAFNAATKARADAVHKTNGSDGDGAQ